MLGIWLNAVPVLILDLFHQFPPQPWLDLKIQAVSERQPKKQARRGFLWLAKASYLIMIRELHLECHDAAMINIDSNLDHLHVPNPQCGWIPRCCRIQCLCYFWPKVNSINKCGLKGILQHSSISQAASITPDENEILSRPARFISCNRLSEEPIWLQNLRLNLLKKSSRSECVNCGKLCIFVIMCMHFAFEIAKRQRHLPDSDGHQRLGKRAGSAQAPQSLPFSVLSPLHHSTKREIMRVTSNAICFESNCAKTSENTKAESAFSLFLVTKLLCSMS